MIIPGSVYRHKINGITLIVIDVDLEQIHTLVKDCKGIRYNMQVSNLLEFYDQVDEYDINLLPPETVFTHQGTVYQKQKTLIHAVSITPQT